MFQLQFNLVEFLTFLSDKYIKNHNKLNDFKNLDTDSEILTLIVEDYILFTDASLFIKQFNTFLETHKTFDVVLISGNNLPPYKNIDDTESINKNIFCFDH